jgi:hypothetical protein
MKKPTNATARAQKLILASRPCLTSPLFDLGSKTAGHSFLDSTNGFCSRKDITQLFDQKDKFNAAYDSDDSSSSSPLSMEDPSEQERPLRQARKTNEGTTLSQLPPADSPSEEEIIRIALEPVSKRLADLPQVFDTTGRLRSGWTHLRPRVEAAKDEKKRQATARKRKAPPLLEAPTGFPIGLNVPSAPQTVENVVVQTTGKPRRWSQSEDPDLSSTHQHGSDLEAHIDPRRARPVKNQFSPSPQANKRLPRIGTFLTPNQKHSDSKINTQRRNQNDKRSSTTTQNHAGYGHFGRTLRSGLPAKPSEAIQSFPIIKLTSHPNQAGQFPSLAPAELPPPSNTSSSTLAREVERSVPNTITVNPSEAKRRLSPLLQSHQIDFVLQTLSAGEQATAARFIHDKIQQQQFRNSTFCATCRKDSCSCNPIQEPLEEILCSERECYKKWWGIEDLWKYCGIKLCDAQETKRLFNCWFCPQCSNKARVLLDTVPTSSPFSSADNPPVIVPEVSGHSDPDNGAWPEDAEIREPLQALTGILQQYTGTTTMARNQLTLINQQTTILEIPCIRDEALQSPGTPRSAIYVIRKLLDVPDGVLIREKVREVKLQDTTCSVWIRGILSYLLINFVFHFGSPFEDAALWRKILIKCKHSNGQNEPGIIMFTSLLMSAKPATLWTKQKTSYTSTESE